VKILPEMLCLDMKVTVKFRKSSLSGCGCWEFFEGLFPTIITYKNSLTNRATRLEILTFEKYRDLKTGVRGHWRSLEMSPFDRAHATSYWCSIVTMVLSSVVSEIFTVEKYRALEIRVRDQPRSLKVVPFDRLHMISYYCSIVTSIPFLS